MRRLLIAIVLLAPFLAGCGLVAGPAQTAGNGASDPGKNDPGYEPTIERDGYVINRRNDADPRSVPGGG